MRQLPTALISLLSVATLVIAHPTDASTPAHASAWRKLVNAIVPRVWNVPVRQSPHAGIAAEEHRHVSSQAAGRYARDVVLRFNLTSVDQALAIKHVANDLFLD